MNRLFFLLLAVLLSIVLVTPVKAVQPDSSTDHFDYSYPVADCGDFVVMDHIVYDVKSTTFYDQSGAPVRIAFQGQGVDNMYNPANPGNIIPGKFSWNAKWDLAANEVTVSGLYIHITLPGRGGVFLDAGKGAFLFLDNGDPIYVPLAGHHELDAEFCAALRVQNP